MKPIAFKNVNNQPPPVRLYRVVIASVTAALLAACAQPAQPATQPAPATQDATAPAAQATAPGAAGEPLYIGVTGPLTGPNAQYGLQWKKGFDLALDEINAKGGVRGRPLAYIFEDSQNDPKQSVAIAQKFVADPRILIEVGDFSSPASMAASPIYQRGKLVQFGFTNSHPDFTKGGDYIWSNSSSQTDAAPALAEFTVNILKLKKIAIFYLNTDWGKAVFSLFSARAKELGLEIVASEAYLPDEKDFRSAITRIRDSNPEAIGLISYYPDAAQIVLAKAAAGITIPTIGFGPVNSPKFIELAGKAAEGIWTAGDSFSFQDPRPEVQNFVKSYRAKHNEEPEFFAVHAYDTIYLLAAAIELGGPDRTAIRDALPKLKDIPSIINVKVAFDPETRRLYRSSNLARVPLQVVDGKFVEVKGEVKVK